MEPGSMLIGLDVGGTKVHGVALSPGRDVLGECRFDTSPGASGVLSTIAAAVDALTADLGVDLAAVRTIGIGVPGLVDREHGIVEHAVNLGITDERFPLAGAVAQACGVPVAVDNDVNAAALGAAQVLGIHADLAYISVGTGLAAGVVVDSQVRRGTNSAVGEIGHLPFDELRLPCNCGQRGCLETVGSGSALDRFWPSTGVPAPRALFDAAAAGDPQATEIRDRFLLALSRCVQILALTVDPDAYVIGGGVSALGEDLLSGVRGHLEFAASESAFLASLGLPDRVKVIPAGSPVAAIGAAIAGQHTGELPLS